MTRINMPTYVYDRRAVNVTAAREAAADGTPQKNIPLIEGATRTAIATGFAVAEYLALRPTYSVDYKQPTNLAARKVDAALAAAFGTLHLNGDFAHHCQARMKVVEARKAGGWAQFMQREIAARKTVRKGLPRILEDRHPTLMQLAAGLGRAQAVTHETAAELPDNVHVLVPRVPAAPPPAVATRQADLFADRLAAQ